MELRRLFPTELIEFAEKLPFDVYVIGGFVRNFFAGLPLDKTDIDLCGVSCASDLNVEYAITSSGLGTAVVKIGGKSYEYTPFRTESYRGGKHFPDAVNLNATIEQDCARRDFTSGCIYYRLRDGKIYDPYGGIEDCRNKILREINDKVFHCDGLRLLRMARIAAETGFEIDADTLRDARANAELLKDIANERKRAELTRILNADALYGVKDAHYRALKLVSEAGLWEHFIPEVAEMKDFPQNPKYHRYDVMEHTFLTVKNCPPDVRLAALFHDIAKPFCQKRDGNMHMHSVEGRAMTEKILKRLGFSKKQVDITCRLVAAHMYDLKGNASFNKVKLFVADNMDIIDRLMELNRADAIGTGMWLEDNHRFGVAKEEILKTNAPYSLSMLDINGDNLLKIGFSGPSVSAELQYLRRECIINPSLNNRDWLISMAEKDFRRGYREESCL